ncbi:MAG: HD-GYP domain-containing protein [Lachnospiraceae bacterium]
MKSYAVKDLNPGMITADSIYSKKGQLILDSGTSLTPALISRLSFYGIESATIQIANSDVPSNTPVVPSNTPVVPSNTPVVPLGNVRNPSYSQRVKQRPEFMNFQISYSKELDSLQNSFDFLSQENQTIDVTQILAQTSTLAKESFTTIELFDMLHNLRQINDSIYAHCLNVSLICHTMGEWMHFSEYDLEQLTLAGLLHDIGKTALPKEILDKPGKYTNREYEYVKQHTLLGYKILKDQPLDIRVKRAALMHHERSDGSGYPQGLIDENIDSFAQIVAIADVYDAMTAARSYRAPLCPFQVITAFETEGLQKYHPEYILTFLEHIANTYQHNRVLLSNGHSATIVMINSKNLTKPMIQLDDKSILDMVSRPDLEIIKII